MDKTDTNFFVDQFGRQSLSVLSIDRDPVRPSWKFDRGDGNS